MTANTKRQKSVTAFRRNQSRDANVVIDLGGGDVIKLLNTDLTSLTVDDFSIV